MMASMNHNAKRITPRVMSVEHGCGAAPWGRSVGASPAAANGALSLHAFLHQNSYASPNEVSNQTNKNKGHYLTSLVLDLRLGHHAIQVLMKQRRTAHTTSRLFYTLYSIPYCYITVHSTLSTVFCILISYFFLSTEIKEKFFDKGICPFAFPNMLSNMCVAGSRCAE